MFRQLLRSRRFSESSRAEVAPPEKPAGMRKRIAQGLSRCLAPLRRQRGARKVGEGDVWWWKKREAAVEEWLAEDGSAAQPVSILSLFPNP